MEVFGLPSLCLGITSGFIYAFYYVYNSWRLFYSWIIAYLVQRRIPPFLRQPIYVIFSRCFGVNQDEITESLESFGTFQEFFIRKIRRREVARVEGGIYAPCDAHVIELRCVESDRKLKTKGLSYTLKKLLNGEEGSFSAKELTAGLSENCQLYAVSFYLSPGDYHRFHSPDDINIRFLKHISGAFTTVNPFRSRAAVTLDENERVILDGQGSLGVIRIAFVAALGVGGIEVLGRRVFKAEDVLNQYVSVGDELGMFLLGSSILMLFAAPKSFKFTISEGCKVKYGQLIGRCQK